MRMSRESSCLLKVRTKSPIGLQSHGFRVLQLLSSRSSIGSSPRGLLLVLAPVRPYECSSPGSTRDYSGSDSPPRLPMELPTSLSPQRAYDRALDRVLSEQQEQT
ncbi:unnamed protein product, partial [Pleuronectes platessa]